MSARILPDPAPAAEPLPLPQWDVACRYDDEFLQEHRLTRRFAAPSDTAACQYMINYLIALLCIVHEGHIKEIAAQRAGRGNAQQSAEEAS